jgi:hypothetical protein
MSLRRAIQLSLMLAALAVSAQARADFAGVVKGRLTHYLHNGAYCPTDRNCSGANYPASQFNTWGPISNGKVRLYMRNSSGVYQVIGSGTTDYNGNYTISWVTITSFVGNAYVAFEGEQKDGRFSLRNPSGGLYRWPTPSFTPTAGTTTAAPQNLGETKFGSAALPDPELNFYAAEHLAWWFGMMGSNGLYAKYTGVQLRGVFEPSETSDPTHDCGTCGSGGSKFVRLHSQYQFDAATVAHESGHVASYVLNPRKSTGDYCYDGSSSGFCPGTESFCCNGNTGIGTHDYNTPEWQHVQFEEGFADVVSAIALYQQFAPQPYICAAFVAAACPTGNIKYQVEPSKGAPYPGTCTDFYERRWEMTAARFLWDAYDSVADSN